MQDSNKLLFPAAPEASRAAHQHLHSDKSQRNLIDFKSSEMNPTSEEKVSMLPQESIEKSSSKITESESGAASPILW